MMVADAPRRFFVPPYVGVNGWIGMRLDVDVDWKEVAGVVAQAYQLAATKPAARTKRRTASRVARR